MLTMVVLGVLVFCGVMALGVLATMLSLLGFLIALPFKILGLALRLVGFAIALPFLLVGGVLALLFGLLPFAPLAALGALAWWLLRGRAKPAAPHASVVS